MATDRIINQLDALKEYRRRIEDIDDALRLAAVMKSCNQTDQTRIKIMKDFCSDMNRTIGIAIVLLKESHKITKQEEQL